MSIADRIHNTIREVPDFPKPGINFKDISPLLKDHELCRDIVQDFADAFDSQSVDAIVGVESRGFLFGMMLAQQMKVPFVLVRKKGKLPYKTMTYSYELEYGSAEVEMHEDELQTGWRVLVHDDLLATGGTAAAAAELIRMQDSTVAGFAFVVELAYLGGADRLQAYSSKIHNLVSY